MVVNCLCRRIKNNSRIRLGVSSASKEIKTAIYLTIDFPKK